MLTKLKLYFLVSQLVAAIGIGVYLASKYARYENRISQLSEQLASERQLVADLNSSLNLLQHEADRLRNERQLISELNLKHKSDLEQIERQFESELESIRKLRQSENETVRVWVDTDLPADVTRMLRYARTKGNNSNGN